MFSRKKTTRKKTTRKKTPPPEESEYYQYDRYQYLISDNGDALTVHDTIRSSHMTLLLVHGNVEEHTFEGFAWNAHSVYGALELIRMSKADNIHINMNLDKLRIFLEKKNLYNSRMYRPSGHTNM